MKKVLILFYLNSFYLLSFSNAQSLGRVGSISDVVTTCTAGTVLMGGGSDVDAAYKWMINRSGGGDFVVVRATGTNAYNSYIYGFGGANSVETFLVASVAMANDSSIVQAVRKAEAIFFAGGDQNDYISYYKGTALGAVFDYLANVKHAPIGGTSAGCAIQSYIYYDGITNVISPDALANPYASGTGIHYNDFLHNPFLSNTICDTHFLTKGGTTSNGITGRQGRSMTFLARMIKDQNLVDVKGIACAEATAVCIDENGIGMVVGTGKAFFLKQWCAAPETCITGVPLTWNSGAKVYVINGPGNLTTLPAANRSLNLTDWITAAGGTYEYWTVNNGLLTLGQTGSTPIINLQPLSTINCGAGFATFSISASGNSGIATPLSFQWLEDGVPITNGSTPNGIYNGATTNTLTIGSPNVALNGKQYSCIASQCNSDTSIVAMLTVATPSVYLGIDVVLGTGSVYQLDAGPGFTGYLWSTGDTTQSISVQTSNSYSVIITAQNGCTASDTINVSFVNGIQENINDERINIYPNPSSNSFFLELDKQEKIFQIEVYNALGQKQINEIFSSGTKHFIEINTLLLSKGIYSIIVLTDKGRRTGVFVKE